MSNYPMVDEVNRLVGNLLAAGSGVFLPGVGSLFVERRGARRLSKRSVQPPCRVVSFSSQQQGVSLPMNLARTLHCDAAGAQDVYDRWLSRTREGDVLTIEGVGVLKFKNFTLAPAFDRLLNPQGHEPVRIKPARRLDWALWVGIAAIVIAAGFGGAEFLRINSSDIPEPGAAAEVARTLPAADAGIPADSSATAGVTDDGTATAVAGTKAAETDVAGSSAAGAAGTADSAGDRCGCSCKPVRMPNLPDCVPGRRHGSPRSLHRSFRDTGMSCWGFSVRRKMRPVPPRMPKPGMHRYAAGSTVSAINSWFHLSRRPMRRHVRCSSVIIATVSPGCGLTLPVDASFRADNPFHRLVLPPACFCVIAAPDVPLCRLRRRERGFRLGVLFPAL